MTKPPPVNPNYLELKATDRDATRTFYGAALGFQFVDYGPNYFAVEGGGAELGFSVGDEPAVPMPTFETKDLGATRAAVIAAGGLIVRDVFDYPGGQRFEFHDPSGNRIGIYQKQS
jgi:predicted enzyme related to lactoylglutathione lyase